MKRKASWGFKLCKSTWKTWTSPCIYTIKYNIKYHDRTDIHSQIKNIHFTVYVHFVWRISNHVRCCKWEMKQHFHGTFKNQRVTVFEMCVMLVCTQGVCVRSCVKPSEVLTLWLGLLSSPWGNGLHHSNTHSILIRPPVSETHGQKHQEHLSGHRLEKRTSYLISVFFSATAMESCYDYIVSWKLYMVSHTCDYASTWAHDKHTTPIFPTNPWSWDWQLGPVGSSMNNLWAERAAGRRKIQGQK